MCAFSVCKLSSTALLAHMTMATGVANQRTGYPAAPVGAAPLKHRKWWNKGARQGDQRYSKNTAHKTVKEQDQSLVPSRLHNLQKHQNRVKTRKFKPKRRVPRTVPRAPFNDSSFLMRVRRSGGIASLVSLAPSSSSVFQSPAFSNLDSVAYQDFLDHEDYGYGSMAGLIRLRDTEVEEDGDSATVVNNFDDVNMCAVSPGQNLEQRVDRFEMTDLPKELVASQRVASQDSRVRYLEDENLVLKYRLFLIQQEVNELRERLRGQSSNLVQENDSTQSCLDS